MTVVFPSIHYSKKQRVPSYTDRILYMAHNDFALEHNVKLDENGRKMPQAMRKKPSRGGPSTSNCGVGCEATEDSPELKLLAYNYLPEYVCSDHRPVFAKFEARVPCSWFQLPVKFIQNSMPEVRDRQLHIHQYTPGGWSGQQHQFGLLVDKGGGGGGRLRIAPRISLGSNIEVHPVNNDLNFLYVALDPPPLNTGGLARTRRRSRQHQQHFCSIRASSNDGLVRHFSTIDRMRSKKKGGTSDSQDDVSVGRMELHPVEIKLLSEKTRRLSVSCEGLEKLHPPAALQVRGKDWVSVYPAGFYNIWKDGLASVYCSTSSLSNKDGVLDKIVEGSMKRSEKMDIVLNRIPPSDIHDKYSLLKGKVDSSVLQRCRSESVQLVYFSKYKNCPQGYSDMIKVGFLLLSFI
ncbi:unnamed protein product [Rodentolepis nana]|uniref:Transducin/WD40 repeat-like superfamily protein n=1 Tax=Rodentolepis nana TaxID=102285 RepID=A0A0R3TBK7_RODNA|nr:unnamed protein product [Rodentolepis nana]